MIIAIKLRKANTPKTEKLSQTIINNCEKVKFLLWEVSQNINLMGMWGATPIGMFFCVGVRLLLGSPQIGW